jgi:WD40 repeat protein
LNTPINDTTQLSSESPTVDQIFTGPNCGLNRPESISYAHDNTCAVIANSGDNSISFYKNNFEPRIESKPYLTLQDACLGYVHDIDFSPCGTMLAAVAREDHSLSIFHKSEPQHPLDSISHKVLIKGSKTDLNFPASVSFDPRGQQLAVANRQTTGISIFKVPDVASECTLNLRPKQVISEHELVQNGMAAPHGLSFSTDGNFLVVLHKRYYLTENPQGKHGISVFRSRPNSRLGIYPTPIVMFEVSDSSLHSISFHPDNQYFAIAGEKNKIDLYQWQPTAEPKDMIRQLPSIIVGNLGVEVKGVSFSADGTQLAACTTNDQVIIFSDWLKIKKSNARNLKSEIDTFVSIKTPLNATPAGSEFLVYYTVGGDQAYADAAILSAKSLKETSSVGFDLLALCDEKLVPQLSKNGFNCRVFSDSESQLEVATRCLKVLDDKALWGYNSIMYLDVDIIADIDVAQYFSIEVTSDTLYVCKEGDIDNFKYPYWGIDGKRFDDQQLAALESKKIYPFNAGFYFFRPSKKMAHDFGEVLKIALTAPISPSWDQSAFNHYFPIHGKLNQRVINSTNYDLAFVRPGEPLRQKGKFVHFCGNRIDIEHKLCKMYRYVESHLSGQYDELRPRRYVLGENIKISMQSEIHYLTGTQEGPIQLNNSARTIIELLDEGWTIREIIDEIAELMSQPHSQIVREVESLVATLLSKHAIQKDAITQKFESSLES